MWSHLLLDNLYMLPHQRPIPNRSLIGASILDVHFPAVIIAVSPGTRSSWYGMSIGDVDKCGIVNFPKVYLLCKADLYF
jgi:hypothetical protein